AQIAAGFKQPLSEGRLRESALSGEIEQLLEWFEARPGDTFFIPAGTVHAIGRGIALCEIQQNSDVTYRLNDYGRPRELHLDKAVEVAELTPVPGRVQPRGEVLVVCDYFVVSALRLAGSRTIPGRGWLHFIIVLEGSGNISGEPFLPGEVWHAPAGVDGIALEGSARLLHVICQDEPNDGK